MNFVINSKIKIISEIAIISSVYAMLTILFSCFSFGIFQFRISEAMITLIYFKKSAFPGLVLGCFFANLFSPFGLIDVIFGTLATIFGLGIFYLVKNKKIIYIFLIYSIVNSIIIGIELSFITNISLLISCLIVFFEEIMVIYSLGISFYLILKKIKFKNDFD